MSALPVGRLLVVSAHFPPDFVSGGTLVPDRQARGLAQRGWDVSVYAGSLDPARRSLEAWDETVDGLAVRWIAIRPFIGWDDERNYDNPAVVADFEAHVARLRPDVVHLHSLQSLGAGLVRAAKRSGAAIVVTMHDFWWCCARQFLVDRAWRPCSLVVDAGVCQCETGRGWLDRRNQRLREALDDIDLVLAPSAIAAEVLAANGIDGDRLWVDENGLPPVRALPSRERAVAPVRFRYAGGENRMKGVQVLFEATARLHEARPDAWSLVVHGDPVAVAHERTGSWPPEVTLEPAFEPDRLDEVLSSTDVLVIPSLMRESHSLLTREALLRGVPVICSDSLGPEEVVVSGQNGLVVPTGDDAALALAMQVTIDDPEQVRRWRAVAPAVKVRSETEQLDDLDRRLRDLAGSASGRTAPARAIQTVLFIVGIEGAPLRYRARLAAEALELKGVRTDVRHYRDASLASLAGQADAVVIYRVPATVQVLALLEDLRERRPEVPLLFDVDDLIFDPELVDEIPAIKVLPPDEADLWMEGVRRYRTTMEACDAFIGSTDALCEHAEAVVGLPAHRWANGVGLLLARRADAALRRPRTPGPLRVGYLSGTTTHDRDWAQVEPVVVDVLERHGEAELWLVGHLTPSRAVERLGPRLRRVPLLDWRDLPGVLRDLDINLAPLEPLGRFNEAKSAIKWLEAALCGTPTIASPTQPFAEVVDPGVNGHLAATPAEWSAALARLLDDQLARASMGARARRDALLRWSPHLQGDRYLEVLEAARASISAGRPPRRTLWSPLALDEPPGDFTLEPYCQVEPAVEVPRSPTSAYERARLALAHRLERTRHVWAEEGARAALRRVGAGLRRDLARVARAARSRRSDTSR